MNSIDLTVGSLYTVTPAEDPSRFAEETEWLRGLQALLESEGVHLDLLSRPGESVLTESVGTFADLYHLRVLAVWSEEGRDLSAITKSAVTLGDEPDPLLAATWNGDRETRYEHLINHSFEGGYYLPVDFEAPIWVEGEDDEEDGESNGEAEPPDSFDDIICFGSSIALARELAELRAALAERSVPEGLAAVRALTILERVVGESVKQKLPLIVW